jgi:hypothetical protein
MATPTPAIPTFTDGQIVHAADLNALGSNITNLFNENQAGFRTQRPCVIAKQTTGQTLTTPNIDYLVNFQTAPVNTDNMWVSSVANQITIQHAGIYWLFGQVRWPPVAGTGVSSSILLNGTSPSNAASTQLIPCVNTGAGPATQNGLIANLAAGSVLYLDVWQNTGGSLTLPTDFGGSYLGAIFLTPSS